jgi:hypothetical protein
MELWLPAKCRLYSQAPVGRLEIFCGPDVYLFRFASTVGGEGWAVSFGVWQGSSFGKHWVVFHWLIIRTHLTNRFLFTERFSALWAVFQLPVFYSALLRFVVRDTLLQITHGVFFAPPNSFLAIILQLPIPKTPLDYSRLLCYTPISSRLLTASFYNPSARDTQKTQPLLLRRRIYCVGA